jgi:hypothetical protein
MGNDNLWGLVGCTISAEQPVWIEVSRVLGQGAPSRSTRLPTSCRRDVPSRFDAPLRPPVPPVRPRAGRVAEPPSSRRGRVPPRREPHPAVAAARGAAPVHRRRAEAAGRPGRRTRPGSAGRRRDAHFAGHDPPLASEARRREVDLQGEDYGGPRRTDGQDRRPRRRLLHGGGPDRPRPRHALHALRDAARRARRRDRRDDDEPERAVHGAGREGPDRSCGRLAPREEVPRDGPRRDLQRDCPHGAEGRRRPGATRSAVGAELQRHRRAVRRDGAPRADGPDQLSRDGFARPCPACVRRPLLRGSSVDARSLGRSGTHPPRCERPRTRRSGLVSALGRDAAPHG